jgi:hypothetical protein
LGFAVVVCSVAKLWFKPPTAAGAALLFDKQPRQISFTGACQYILSSRMLSSCMALKNIEAYILQLLEQISACEVAHRPRGLMKWAELGEDGEPATH